jgi:TldD protein
MRIAAVVVLAGLLAQAPLSRPAVRQEKDDLLFRVLQDEMTRATGRLKIEKSGPPYYVEYTALESEFFQATASFGAITGQGGGKSRSCSIDLRVGDHRLDNTNFAGNRSGGRTSLTVDDDYDALRHELWLATDRVYKSAVEELEKKKAFLQQNTVQDRPDDLSKEEPVVHLEAPAKLEIDRDKWSGVITQISAVFKEFPRIQKSMSLIVARAETRWFLNNEGFRNRVGETGVGILFGAVIQAEDGTKIGDAEVVSGRTTADLPSPEAIIQTARELAKRLEALASAPKAEEYTGPILFEGAAGASFFSQALGPQLGSSHEALGRGGAGGNPWKEKIGQRVTKAFLSVASDPTAREFQGAPVFGGYEVDDDGVRGRRVSLIENGVLKNFCMSRIPTRNIKKSNGHSQGGVGGASTLFVSSTKQENAEGLRKRLFELGKDEGLTYVYIVRKLAHPFSRTLDYAAFDAISGARGQVSINPAIYLYRVDMESGKEELVRGARWGSITLKILREIVATGDDTRAWITGRLSDPGMVIAPSVLIEEIEINKPGKETEKLPSYPHPLFEGK